MPDPMELGGERVTVQLGDVESPVIERYDIRQSFFNQPGIWALRVGHSATARPILETYAPGLDYTLWITLPDGRKIAQMTGRLDDQGTEPGAGATEVTLRGRDWMMPLRSMPRVERTFGRATFADLVETILKEAGVEEPSLFYDDAANRAAVIGTPKVEKTTQTVREFEVQDATAARVALVSSGEAAGSPFAYDVVAGTPARLVALPDSTVEVTKVVGYDVPNPLKLQLGTEYLHFLQQELNRTGLFLFAAVAPRTYILTRPDVLQAPTWRIVVRRGMSWGVEQVRYSNNTTDRFSHYVVRGRGGGGADGQKQIYGEYVDQEMVDYGLAKVWSKVDTIAKTSKQAEYLARRQAAEKARAGWSLAYTLRGLSWPTIEGGRAIWSVNTIVDIQDEERGIFGPHWIGEVVQMGAADDKTSTTITLHKPAHLVFGDEVLPTHASGKKGWKS